jgi:hypothetical protein
MHHAQRIKVIAVASFGFLSPTYVRLLYLHGGFHCHGDNVEHIFQ